MNCGTENAGSCHGGEAGATFAWIKKVGGVPVDNCLTYEACSSESKETNCLNRDFSCSAANTCRTCNTFSDMGGKCTAIYQYPKATITEFGKVKGVH